MPLSKLLLENQNSNNSERASFSLNESGQLCSSSVTAHKRRFDSIDSWLEAYPIFMRFRMFYRPDLPAGLAAYLDIKRAMATHRPLNNWFKYDRCFRERIGHADADNRSWFCEDPFIMSEVLKKLPASGPNLGASPISPVFPPRPVFRLPPGHFCFICGELTHYAPACPSQPPKRQAPGSLPVSAPFPNQAGPSVRGNPFEDGPQPLQKASVVVCRDYKAGKFPTPCPERQLHICDISLTRPINAIIM